MDTARSREAKTLHVSSLSPSLSRLAVFVHSVPNGNETAADIPQQPPENPLFLRSLSFIALYFRLAGRFARWLRDGGPIYNNKPYVMETVIFDRSPLADYLKGRSSLPLIGETRFMHLTTPPWQMRATNTNNMAAGLLLRDQRAPPMARRLLAHHLLRWGDRW